MSSGRLFLDRVARLQSPSLLHRQCQDKAIASSGQKIYHRTVESVLTVCLTKQGNPKFHSWFPAVSLAEAQHVWLAMEERFFAKYELFVRV